jgi:hypothetical protein
MQVMPMTRLLAFEGDTCAARRGQDSRELSWSEDRVRGASLELTLEDGAVNPKPRRTPAYLPMALQCRDIHPPTAPVFGPAGEVAFTLTLWGPQGLARPWPRSRCRQPEP